MASELERIQERLGELDRRREELFDELGALSAEQLEYHPTGGGWSLLEVAQHMMLVDEAMASRTAGGKKPRRIADRIGHFMVRLVLSLGIKVKVPSEALAPGGPVTLAEIRERWSDVYGRVKSFVAEFSPEDLSLGAFRHVYGWFTLDQGVGFLELHFHHHRKQMARIRKKPGFPTAA